MSGQLIVDNRAGPSSPDLKEQISHGLSKTTQSSQEKHQKAIKAAKRKQTLRHLPKKTRQALGKQAAKVRQSRK
jgi:hypothetical protein